MGSDGLGLLLLAAALLIALLGTWDVIVGRARADELRERALGAPPRSPLEVLWLRLEAAVGRTKAGRALSVRLIGAGVRRTPLQFVLIAIALAIVAYVASTLVVPPSRWITTASPPERRTASSAPVSTGGTALRRAG